ncbi:hypothetical protein LCGC14_0713310, partial [marine sediment metagenome]
MALSSAQIRALGRSVENLLIVQASKQIVDFAQGIFAGFDRQHRLCAVKSIHGKIALGHVKCCFDQVDIAYREIEIAIVVGHDEPLLDQIRPCIIEAVSPAFNPQLGPARD